MPYNGMVISGCRPHEFYLVKRIPFRRAWVSSIRFDECEPFIKQGLAGAIRLDDNPSFTIIRENVITESERGLGLKGPADVINNFIFTKTFLRGRSLPGWLGGTKKALPQRNIFMPPASSKSTSGLYLTYKRATNRPFYENLPKMEDSIYFTENKSTPYAPKAELGSDLFAGKLATPGKDPVKLLYTDPMFDKEAMKEGLYRFKKGSPAEKLGIKPIDLRKVGSSLANPLKTPLTTQENNTVFEFTDGTALDAKAGIVGARIIVDGVTLTTRAIIGSDRTTTGNTTTIFKNVDALSINTKSVGGSEYQNFDPNEAWVFDFNTDVTLESIRFNGLEDGETMTITILDGSNAGQGIVQTATNTNILALNKQVAAGTDIRIEQITGKARIDSIAITN